MIDLEARVAASLLQPLWTDNLIVSGNKQLWPIREHLTLG
jgi:hypothetical protein